MNGMHSGEVCVVLLFYCSTRTNSSNFSGDFFNSFFMFTFHQTTKQTYFSCFFHYKYLYLHLYYTTTTIPQGGGGGGLQSFTYIPVAIWTIQRWSHYLHLHLHLHDLLERCLCYVCMYVRRIFGYSSPAYPFLKEKKCREQGGGGGELLVYPRYAFPNFITMKIS